MKKCKNETKVELDRNLEKIKGFQGMVSNRLLSKVAGEVIIDYYQMRLRKRDYSVSRQFIVEQTNLILQTHNFESLSYEFFRAFKF